MAKWWIQADEKNGANMIRQSIEKGATVFHEALGFGTFISWSAGVSGEFARIQYDDGVHTIHRKRLTEIEEGT